MNIIDELKKGVNLQRSGQFTEAKELYLKLLEHTPSQPDALHLLGLVYSQEKSYELAINSIKKAIELRPQGGDYHYNLAQIYQLNNQLDLAIRHFQEALHYHPTPVKVHLKMAKLYQHLQDFNQVFHHYYSILRLESKHSEAIEGVGNLLMKTGRIEKARTYFSQLFKRQLRPFELHSQMGEFYFKSRALNEAQLHWEEAHHIQPNHTKAIEFLAKVYRAQGKLLQGIFYFEQLLSITPKQWTIYNSLGLSWQELGDIEQAINYFRKALTIAPNSSEAHSNLICCLRALPGNTSQHIFSESYKWANLHALDYFHKQVMTTNHPLNIGYISADFRYHSAAISIEQLILNHTKAVHTYLYSDNSSMDPKTAQFQQYADYWRETVHLSDHELYQMIQEDKIDILVDLTGHAPNHRLKLFSMKPAPIQVSGLGYGCTTGLDSIDYLFSDPVITTLQQCKYQSEKVVYLSSLIHWAPPDFQVNISKIKTKPLVLGCGQSLFKINQKVIECWSTILKELPTAQLAVKSKGLGNRETADYFISHFESHQIDPARILLSGHSSYQEHLEFYNSIDIALEPFPYQGGISTCESLWMGVPTLALKEGIQSAVSILTICGFQDWIASSLDEYIMLVKKLAQAKKRESHSIRQQFLASPICDGKGFALEVEKAYQMMAQKLTSSH